MSILFINGSPNKNGNTAALAQILLKGKEYETLNLTEYKVYSYGHKFEDDHGSHVGPVWKGGTSSGCSCK